MALSDACLEFCESVRAAGNYDEVMAAVLDLREAVQFYSKAPFSYPADLLRVLNGSCSRYLEDQDTPHREQTLALVVSCAGMVRSMLDTGPVWYH